MSGRRLRRFFTKFTGKDWQSALLGAATGFITQSTSVAAFITAGLISGGLTTVRNALPVMMWANAGCSLLVVIAVLDIHYFIAVLLFVSGLSYAFDKPQSLRYLSRALFGIGLLYYGLQLIRTGAAPMTNEPWVRDALAASDGSLLLALGLGFGLAILTQAFIGVLLIAIAMHTAGLFTVDQTIILIYGVHIGSGTSTWFLSSGLTGSPKQIVMSQILFNYIGALILVPLLLLEIYGGVPLVKALVASITPDLERQMVYIIVLFNFIVPMAVFLFHTPIVTLLNRFWPPTPDETLGRPAFINELVMDAPETALDLVEKEMNRLFTRLPAYLTHLRDCLETGTFRPLPGYHAAFIDISTEIRHSFAEISQGEISPDMGERLITLQARLRHIVILEEALSGLCDTAEDISTACSAAREFHQVLLESLDFLILTAVQAAMGDEEERSTLRVLTATQGDMINSARSKYLSLTEAADLRDRAAMHRASNLFERSAWVLHKLSTTPETA